MSNNEWYTPAKYIEAARRVMGSIDLDPASSNFAQKTVKADWFYTSDSSGLDKDWKGNIWMNPPYSMPEIRLFINKLLDSQASQWIVLVNNSSDTSWFHDLLSTSDSVCFTKGRISFENNNNEKSPVGARQGQAFFYKGCNVVEFSREFRKFGAILEVIHDHTP
jgi:ParB family chromosome partitioning protein